MEKSLALADALGITWGMGQINGTLGIVKAELGQYKEGRRGIEQALVLNREADYKWGIGASRLHLGRIALAEGEYVEARQHLQESVDVFRASGQRSDVGWPLAVLGAVASRLGQISQAREYLCEALRLGCHSARFGHEQDSSEEDDSQKEPELFAQIGRSILWFYWHELTG